MKTWVYLIIPVILIVFILGYNILIRIFQTKEILITKSLTPVIISASDSSALSDYIVITETPVPTNTPKPTPTPTVTPIRLSAQELEELFTRYANKESINPEKLKRIALCESGFNPYASNGVYGGMFQFSVSSWISTRHAMNLNTNPDFRFIPEEAIKTAAFKIATEGIYAWPECSKK
jgi:hypothetical protein